LTLFLHCFGKGHPELQTIALQIMTDILTTHPSLLAAVKTSSGVDTTSSTTSESPSLLKPVLKAFSKALKSESPEVQATSATSLSKLMLSQLIVDTDLLKQLIVTFFDPETASNAQLRQALAYFLPVYCHSRYENAVRMVSVATSVINRVGLMRETFVEEAEEAGESDDMVTTAFVGGLLVDWTDPRKILTSYQQGSVLGHRDNQTKQEKERVSTHFLMAEQILEQMVTGQTTSGLFPRPKHDCMLCTNTLPIEEERKVLFSMLGKLHLSASTLDFSSEIVTTLLELIAEATETRLSTDATSRNVLSRLQTTLLKLVHDSAGAERGVDDEVTNMTSMTATPKARTARGSTLTVTADNDDVVEDKVNDSIAEEDEEDEEDELTLQLRQDLEHSRIEDDTEIVPKDADGGFDTSQLPDDQDMQSLIESLDDEDEELL